MTKPTIVCLCGSTRFSEAFREANLRETLAGKIVLSIGCDFKSDDALGLTADDKARMDELHLRKIDLADEVLILNVGGYIGESTKRELTYAEAHGKRIRFLEPRDWQVGWYQSLLLMAGVPAEVEVLEDNLTKTEAERKALEWRMSLASGIGVVVIARPRPAATPADDGEIDGDA